ncbi:PIH1 domain-containing protein 2-like [Watersipora subatra]|uniref:PIH1 domain-containing protein 2-like n=1 Tax=Watersipora subatra TaxID=2589382 RepID=UPI00355B9A65
MKKMEDPKMLGQASQIWSMLDDMAENNPSAYRKFIDKQLKEGREHNKPPEPHMCVQTCLSSTWIPVYINLCSWKHITKPKDDSAPIPVFGGKLIKKDNEQDDEHFIINVAFHPEVLEKFGKQCTRKDEQEALIHLAITYAEDQNSIKLSAHYYIQDFNFKGDNGSIRDDFGLPQDPMKKELEKLAKSFAPLADIATKDPELIEQQLNGSEVKVSLEEKNQSDIKIPGVTTHQDSNGSACKLIEEIKLTPTYTLTYKNVDVANNTKSIMVKIDLEKVKDVQECILDISENTLRLSSKDYSLNLDLPESIAEDEVKARFSRTKHQLTVTLPILA